MSLADFSPESVSMKWYNILGSQFMQQNTPSRIVHTCNSSTSAPSKSDVSRAETNETRREESSDESTIISSQASTLTRAAVVESCAPTFCLAEEDEEDVLEQVFPSEVSFSLTFSTFDLSYIQIILTCFFISRMNPALIKKPIRNVFSYPKKATVLAVKIPG